MITVAGNGGSFIKYSVLHGTGHIDGGLLAGALLKVVVGNQPGLAGGVADHNAALLETLDVGLVVAPDAIADGHEGELVLVEDVAAVGGQLQEPLGEAVVVLLLLDGVVQGGVAQVLVTVGDEELFELMVG